jgi:acetoin utilization deacetylase AcuC-like enzyme
MQSAMKTRIVFSEKCLGYGTWHIEGPQRVKAAHDVLQAKGYEFEEPTPANDEEILAVHDADYLFNVKKGLVEDSDTPAYQNIYEFARLSVGGALLASKINGFSIMRPPGHHVGRNGAALGVYTRGFCYLNNIAIAVKESRKRTVILDIDGHHGNGTQEIFQGDEKVAYISLHQSHNYPGTGNFTEENCINFAIPRDIGGKRYIETLDKALSMVNLANFETVAVSAGFDTHLGDLATLGLVEKDYFEIGRRVSLLKKPTFFILEGGYVGEKVGLDIDSFLKGYEENL